MGQMLILQAPGEAAHNPLWARSLSVVDAFAGVRAGDELVCGPVRAAKYPRLAGSSTEIFRDPSSGTWACGTGTWFYDGLPGLAGLQRFCGAAGGAAISDSALRSLDGSFAIVMGRSAEGGFYIITDRIGTIHIYVASVAGSRIVCTSSAALACICRADWDEWGCREFLATGTVFEDRTLFRGVEKMGPARVTYFPDAANRAQRTWWQVREHMFDADSSGSVVAVAEGLEESVNTVLRAYPKAIFDLTGGYDSRAVLGAALRTQSSVSTVVNGSDGDKDVIAANRIAREFALDHRHQRRQIADPWRTAARALSLCDGEYDVLEYSGTLAAHLPLAETYSASVNGSNGEICKGYWWELLFPHVGSKRHFDSRVVAQRRFLVDTRAAHLMESDGVTLIDHFAAIIDRANAPLAGYPNTALMDNVHLALRMQRWQGRTASATNRIWPCISPFMFRAVMEAALAAPPRVRTRHRMTSRLIERLNPRLAALPLAQGYPALPLRPGTAYRFGPLCFEFAGAVRRRIAGKLPQHLRPSSGAGRPEHSSATVDSAEYRDLMQPPRMKTAHLYEPARLVRFLGNSASPDTRGMPHAGRVLTLELLARRIDECETISRRAVASVPGRTR